MSFSEPLQKTVPLFNYSFLVSSILRTISSSQYALLKARQYQQLSWADFELFGSLWCFRLKRGHYSWRTFCAESGAWPSVLFWYKMNAFSLIKCSARSDIGIRPIFLCKIKLNESLDLKKLTQIVCQAKHIQKPLMIFKFIKTFFIPNRTKGFYVATFL